MRDLALFVALTLSLGGPAAGQDKTIQKPAQVAPYAGMTDATGQMAKTRNAKPVEAVKPGLFSFFTPTLNDEMKMQLATAPEHARVAAKPGGAGKATQKRDQPQDKGGSGRRAP